MMSFLFRSFRGFSNKISVFLDLELRMRDVLVSLATVQFWTLFTDLSQCQQNIVRSAYSVLHGYDWFIDMIISQQQLLNNYCICLCGQGLRVMRVLILCQEEGHNNKKCGWAHNVANYIWRHTCYATHIWQTPVWISLHRGIQVFNFKVPLKKMQVIPQCECNLFTAIST